MSINTFTNSVRWWLYVKKWSFINSPLAEAIRNPHLRRSYLRHRYWGIRYGVPYWAAPRWRLWWRDRVTPWWRRMDVHLIAVPKRPKDC